jgi:hypothetical protein
MRPSREMEERLRLLASNRDQCVGVQAVSNELVMLSRYGQEHGPWTEKEAADFINGLRGPITLGTIWRR